VLVASDLLLSLNAMATTLGAAAQMGVPILLGTNAFGGSSVDEIAAAVSFTLSPRVREQLATLVPLHPFRVWPYGLFRFTAPVIADNPCFSMVRPFEVLDEEGFVTAATEMLWSADAIAGARARMDSCLAAVRALPSAVDVFAHHLTGT
jgi:hypothetical protein